jgi:hypothetical protein
LTVRKTADHNVIDTKDSPQYVYIVKVASLVPSEGTEIDDGDGNADTKSYIVPIATTGTINVTATSEPDLPPELLVQTDWNGGRPMRSPMH